MHQTIQVLSMHLDAHSRPPECVRLLFKRWQKSTLEEIDKSLDVLDFTKSHTLSSPGLIRSRIQDGGLLKFEDHSDIDKLSAAENLANYHFRYEVKALPGLFVYPALLPVETQIKLLDKMVHRDLSQSQHKTNLHLHYEIPYSILDMDHMRTATRSSFFQIDEKTTLQPKDASIHKPLTVRQMLQRKLRWMTLGGQYDWTAKIYPTDEPPKFPSDIGQLLSSAWPDVDPQAAIINFYTPGDTLSVHRDVSEECDRGLISISIGCDGIFVIGDEDGAHSTVLRLRSGDAVLMSDKSRFAWHGVPKILTGTCPLSIQDWPANDSDLSFDNWRGWMSTKRINLNVRQMKAETDL